MINKKMMAMPILLVMVLSIVGISYGLWSETLFLNGTVGTGELDIEIKGPFKPLDGPSTLDWNGNCTWDTWQTDKDVGGPTVMTPYDSDGDGDYDKLNITLVNVYPYYLEDPSFWVHNDGTIPFIIEMVKINGVPVKIGETVFLDLTGDGKDDIKIMWGNSIGWQGHPCQSHEISFLILVLQDAPENACLSFIVEIVAYQYNESSFFTTTSPA
ncbi:MAG: hypothetical protein QXJ17_08185 [Nitrososphaeria archaeon]